MREIRFRVIDPNTKKIVGIETWDIMFGWAFVIHPDDTVRVGTFPDGVDRNIRNQFTGLKDKKGKDIYEGDIVRSETYEVLGVVEWSYEHWAPFQYYMSQVEEDFEVIGNIFENPELLKQ